MKPEILKILVIDDEIGSQRSSQHQAFIKKYREIGFEWTFCDSRKKDGHFSVDAALEFVHINLDASLILLDIMFGSHARLGLDILERIKEIYSYIPVIMLTSVSEKEIRDKCLRKAETYLIKDTFSKEELKQEIQHYAIPAKDRIVGSSKVMNNIRSTLAGYAAAPSQAVIITGATGTGKELAARNIHRLSARRSKPFIALNCAQIADSLEGSELFGHVRGAFTGADKDKVGLIEAADGGTLFLDEIGTMRLGLQEKLLRVIEDGLIRRIGDTKDRNVDVRLVAATNSDLKKMVAEGSFSEALFFRLYGLAVNLPALKERVSDIPELVDYWLSFWHYREYASDSPFRISRDAIQFLMAHSWPGNVRQLVQALGSAIVECYKIAHDTQIEVKHLPLYVRNTDMPSSVTVPGAREFPTLPEQDTDWANFRSMWEIRFVCQALARMGDNSTQTIKALFPNVDAPSETYLRRLAYNIVEGTWGNRAIMTDPKLHEAFKPLLGAYLKEKEQASKNQAKNIIHKLKGALAAEMDQSGIATGEMIHYYEISDWGSLSKLAQEAKNRLSKRSSLAGAMTKFLPHLDSLHEAAGFLASMGRIEKL